MDKVPIWVLTYVIEVSLLLIGVLGFLFWRARRHYRQLGTAMPEAQPEATEQTDMEIPQVTSEKLSATPEDPPEFSAEIVDDVLSSLLDAEPNATLYTEEASHQDSEEPLSAETPAAEETSGQEELRESPPATADEEEEEIVPLNSAEPSLESDTEADNTSVEVHDSSADEDVQEELARLKSELDRRNEDVQRLQDENQALTDEYQRIFDKSRQ